MKKPFLAIILLSSLAFAHEDNPVKLVVLGIAQDAGYPQLNCYKPHCMPAWNDLNLKKSAVSLGLIDKQNKKKYLFDATPDIRQQMYELHRLASDSEYTLDGIFLTHAHMGHYTGLMHMGKEAAGTKGTKVYTMPKMKQFLETNGPWSQLVDLKNISLIQLENQQAKNLTNNVSIKPILVPHRDEFSETVGYEITGPNKTALFIPDINKWQKWNLNIVEQIKRVDYALLDATFYQNGEIPNRDMSEIPHPFVEESMALFKGLSKSDKNKVIFIHFNHSNPLLQKGSKAQSTVKANGYNFAFEGMQLTL